MLEIEFVGGSVDGRIQTIPDKEYPPYVYLIAPIDTITDFETMKLDFPTVIEHKRITYSRLGKFGKSGAMRYKYEGIK